MKETAAGHVNQVRDKALSVKEQASERIRGVASQLQSVSSTLRDDDPLIADFAERASQRIESVARYVSSANAQTFIQDTEQIAQRRPALFFGGAFLLGLAAGRFLKSASPGGGALQVRAPQDDALQVAEERSGPLAPRQERESGIFSSERSAPGNQRLQSNLDAAFARDVGQPREPRPVGGKLGRRGDTP